MTLDESINESTIITKQLEGYLSFYRVVYHYNYIRFYHNADKPGVHGMD